MTGLLSVPLGHVLLALAQLQDQVTDEEDVTAGWIYPAVFFALVAVTVLLWLSMRKQLKKIRFPDNDQPGSEPDEEKPAG